VFERGRRRPARRRRAERTPAVRRSWPSALTRVGNTVASGTRSRYRPVRRLRRRTASPGLLVCPSCSGHFEARKYPGKGQPGDVYMCATRRRKPGICSNPFATPITSTDDAVLSIIEAETLGGDLLEEPQREYQSSVSILSWAARPRIFDQLAV